MNLNEAKQILKQNRYNIIKEGHDIPPTNKKIKNTFSDDDIHKAIFGSANNKKDLMDELKLKKFYGSALKSYKNRFCHSIKNLLVYVNKKIKQYGLTTELYYYNYDNVLLKITCEDIKNLDTFSSLYIAIKDGDTILSLIGRYTDDVYASSKYEDYVNVSLVLYDDYYAISDNEGISFNNVDELINYFITTKL